MINMLTQLNGRDPIMDARSFLNSFLLYSVAVLVGVGSHCGVNAKLVATFGSSFGIWLFSSPSSQP